MGHRATGALFAAVLLVSGLATTAQAQCLPSGERDAFVNGLVRAMRTSDLTVAEAYDHAANRLGFGWRGDNRSGRSHRALAELIADRLEQAGSGVAGRDERLAAVRDDDRNTTVNGLRRPYRGATKTMAQSYREVRRYNDIHRGVQNDPNATSAERRVASRNRIFVNGDYRLVAGTRTISHALAGGNVDLGMVLREFWFNHFNVDGSQTTWATVDYQKTIRRQQCRTFHELLRATGQHPAMLIYLDNRRSRRNRINENYARELLELHTLGDDRFRYYQQDDIVGVAELITGWTVSGLTPTGGDPRFDFNENLHDRSAQALFRDAPRGVPFRIDAAPRGMTEEEGIQRGNRLFRYLARHPATREHVCGKLSRRLMGRAPRSIVDTCASDAVWGDRGDLSAVYQALLTSPEMWQRNSYRNRWKNPLELLVSARRSTLWTGAYDLARLRGAWGFIASLGIPVGRFPPPTGYPDDHREWLGSSPLVLWQQELFQNMPVQGVDMVTGSGELRGQALADWLDDRIQSRSGDERTAEIDRLTNRLVLELGLPSSMPVARRGTRRAMQRPDVRPSGRRQPVRSAIHAILSSPQFMRK